MYFLSKELWFPPVNMATREGILAVGGDLSPDRLLLAYKSGIFPWYTDGEPIIWHSPNPRMVLFPDKLKVSKSMKKVLEKEDYKVTINKDFRQVIDNCQNIVRKTQNGTWITDEMKEAYILLHRLGSAKSIEIWRDDELIGGLYGVDAFPVFCGESMFSKEPNASKIALFFLVKIIIKNKYKLIDCQVYNDHLASLGAVEIPRGDFMKYLDNYMMR